MIVSDVLLKKLELGCISAFHVHNFVFTVSRFRPLFVEPFKQDAASCPIFLFLSHAFYYHCFSSPLSFFTSLSNARKTFILALGVMKNIRGNWLEILRMIYHIEMQLLMLELCLMEGCLTVVILPALQLDIFILIFSIFIHSFFLSSRGGCNMHHFLVYFISHYVFISHILI